ncbi:MAG: prolyl oligopeptidase family serine peptidase [Bacteroidales bacterium]|nr:MAG: prolyl oligopeptidase family serine peptidase [Bacteroidales bacterium]
MTKTRTLLLTLWALVLTVLSASGRGVEPDSLLVFRHGGMERSYRLYVPDSLAAGRPLVIMLHGYGGHASPEAFGILAAARRYGFAACFPQGAEDARGKSCWNVGYPFQEGLQTDDVDFICSLAAYLVGEYGLDARNVFCTGHSNGGEMCYLMACRRPDVFAAVAPIAGLTLEWMYHDLEASKPIPLMEPARHGGQDLAVVRRPPQRRGLGRIYRRTACGGLLGCRRQMYVCGDRGASDGQKRRARHGPQIQGRHGRV